LKCTLARFFIDDLQVAAKAIIARQEQPAPHAEIDAVDSVENTSQREVAVAIWIYFAGLDLLDGELRQVFETFWVAPFSHGR